MFFVVFLITLSWEFRVPAPGARTYPAIGNVVAINSSGNVSVYVIGGETGLGQTSTNYEYDCVTNTWASQALMPPPERYDFAGCSAYRGGVERIYVIGGYQSIFVYLTDVDEYTPSTNSWTEMADMPTQREGVRAANIGNLIYAIGGDYFDFNNGIVYVYDIVERYNPETNTWTTGYATMPTARTDACCAVATDESGDSCIYVFGGSTSIISYVPTNAVEEYNPATDSWRTRNSTGFTARGGVMAAAGNNNKIYVIGGTSDGVGSLDLVQVFDPVANSWSSETSIQVARDGVTGGIAGIFGGRIHVVVGSTGANAVTTNERSVEIVGMEEFTAKNASQHDLNIFPNPFNSSASIYFNLNRDGNVSLKMYNVVGKEVMTLVNDNLAKGEYKIKFSAKDLPSGVYYYSLKTRNSLQTKRCVLLK